MYMNNQNDPNKKLTITTLKTAVIRNNLQQIQNSISQYGIPKSGPKTTDYSILQLALEKKKIEIAKLLINAGCRVNKKANDTGNTPLAMAVLAENEELATLLLQKEASWLTGDDSGLSVLHLAAQNRSIKMLTFLLRYPVNINHISNGKTPFQVFLASCHSIYEKDINLVRLFLAKGASINFKTSDGQTVLHHIVKSKFNDVIEHVLRATVDVNVQSLTAKNTALHNFLNESNSSEDNIVKIVKMFILKGAKVNIQNASGDTAVHLAAKKKFLQVLQMFQPLSWDINCCNKDGNTVLHCILMGSAELSNNAQYLQIVNHILKQNPLMLVENNRNKTPLHCAAEYRQNQILNEMLSKPVNINAVDEYGCSALYIFMKTLIERNIVPEKNDIEIIKKMISLGADPATRHRSTGDTPVHLALRLRNKEILLLMLDRSFDYDNFDNITGKSILHCFIIDKSDFTETEELHMAEVAEICIKKGATVDVKDQKSKTPLYWAVALRQRHMVKVLLEYGADPNLSDNEGKTILENLMKKEVAVTVRDSYSWHHHVTSVSNRIISPDIERDSEIAQMLLFKGAVAEKSQTSIFHYCAAYMHLNTLHKIIPYCKDPDVRDSDQNTILHAVLNYNLNTNEEVEDRVAEIVAILLFKGAEVAAVNEKGEAPLHLAVKGKNLKASKVLLQQGASVADLDSNGNCVLHFLCMQQSKVDDSVEDRLTEFISKGCDINAKNNDGMTPLLFAAESGAGNMIRILMELKAKVDCVENANLSLPIHLAAENNHQNAIEQLLHYGVDVNARRRDRKTPLHLSVAHNLPKVTRLLLENGADSDLKDGAAKTPLHWACWYDSLDNINELLDYGADVNVEDNFRVIPLMLISRSSIGYKKLRYHVVKLKAAGMHISNHNKVFIEESDKEYANYAYSSELREFESLAIEETLKMEQVPIAPRTSLADVLLMSANKLSVFKCNEEFQKLLYSEDFKDKFPIYADLVRACYRKGIIRSDLMISAKVAFRKMLGLALPDTCCDVIFYYLDNENLHNLDKAAKIRITKRKRFMDEMDEIVPAKRVRRISV